MFVDSATKKKLKDKYHDEQVFVVPFDTVAHIKDKFTPAKSDIQSLNQYDNLGRFILRYDAEYNPAFQQLIPYVLIMNKTGDKYYVSKRIAGDTRLLQSYSLGFGGHINPCDNGTSIILNALRRELNEEVEIKPIKDSIEFVGYVRDLTSDTSEHLGFVFAAKASSVKIKEKNVLKGFWMTKEELIENYFNFEGWARHIIDFLYESSEKK